MPYAEMEGAKIYYEVVGSGHPIFVLHGGPDLDHTYLRPGLDFLAESCRLVFYDQRGRGRSVALDESVCLATELRDFRRLVEQLDLGPYSLLSHSWGGVLALEIAVAAPLNLTHLILLNPAPITFPCAERMQAYRLELWGSNIEPIRALKATEAFIKGEPQAVSEYYKVFYRSLIKEPAAFDKMDLELSHFTREGIGTARKIERDLFAETLNDPRFDMRGRMSQISANTLLIHGTADFVPVDCAAEIAGVIPGAQLQVLPECGHFSFVERPNEVRHAITKFLSR